MMFVDLSQQSIFQALFFGYVLVYFHRLCAAMVAVNMMRNLDAGTTLIGVLASAYYLSACIYTASRWFSGRFA